MARFDQRIINGSLDRTRQMIRRAIDDANQNAEERRLSYSLREQTEVLSRWEAEPEGWKQWHSAPDTQETDLSISRSILLLAWWTDFLGRKHTRAFAHRGRVEPHQLVNLLSPFREPLSPVWMVYPDYCFEQIEGDDRHLRVVCSCGLIGSLEELAWMGELCGPCYDRLLAQEQDPFARSRRFTIRAERDFSPEVVWAPDSRQMAWSVWGGHFCALDLESGQQRKPKIPGTGSQCLGFVPEGILANLYRDGIYLISPGGERLRKFERDHDEGPVLATSTARNGSLLAVADHDFLTVWQVETGEEIFRQDIDRITDLAIAPNGEQAVAGFVDGTLHVWSIPTGEEIYFQDFFDFVVDEVAISPDGRWLALQLHLAEHDPGVLHSHLLHVLDFESLKVEKTVPLSARRAQGLPCFSADSRFLAYPEQSPEIHIREVGGSGRMARLHFPGTGSAKAVFSPDHQWLAISVHEVPRIAPGYARVEQDGTHRIWSWPALRDAIGLGGGNGSI